MSSSSSLKYSSSFEYSSSSSGASSGSYLSSQDANLTTSSSGTGSSGTGSSASQADTVPYDPSPNSDPTGDILTLKETNAWGILYAINENYKTVHLEEDKPFIVGRDKSCQYRLLKEDGFSKSKELLDLLSHFSKKHFRIYKEVDTMSNLGFSVRLEDLSSNGTLVNGCHVGKGHKYSLINTSRIALVNKKYEAFIFVNVKDMLEEHEALPKDFKKKYYLERERLGAGATGVVRRGRIKSSDNFMAVKIIEKKVTPEFKDMTYEANLMLRLDHPNVVKLYDVYDSELLLHLVLEFVAGGSLFEYIQLNEHIKEDISKTRFQELLNATSYLHTLKIIHRDLKPENILLTSSCIDTCTFKITDFGLSRLVGTQSFMRTMCGTPAYCAPEVLQGEQRGYTKKIDVWSLGCILYFMLSGKMAFTGGDVDAVKSGKFAFLPESAWDDITTDAKDLIANMLTVCPDERIAIEDVANAEWYKHTRLVNVSRIAGKRKFEESPTKSLS